MKMQSAANLLKELPAKFDVLRDDMLKDMSDAYFDTETNYEKVIEKAEERIRNRGLNMLYMATGISTEQTKKPAIHTANRKQRITDWRTRNTKQEIFEIIKHANPKLTGDIMDNEILKNKIFQAKLCKYCLEPQCRRRQLENKEKAKCNQNLNNLDNYETSKIQETNKEKKEILNNKFQRNQEKI